MNRIKLYESFNPEEYWEDDVHDEYRDIPINFKNFLEERGALDEWIKYFNRNRFKFPMNYFIYNKNREINSLKDFFKYVKNQYWTNCFSWDLGDDNWDIYDEEWYDYLYDNDILQESFKPDEYWEEECEEGEPCPGGSESYMVYKKDWKEFCKYLSDCGIFWIGGQRPCNYNPGFRDGRVYINVHENGRITKSNLFPEYNVKTFKA
ncbi:MAG: hypothetical protein KDH96_12495 [Candidatus Riesia sp.]|nr:hypothetical protein [Candidatus Riesia sp.]